VHYTHFGGWALIERGRAAWDVGRLDRAEADFRKANLLLTKLQAHYDMARSSMYLAAILNETHDPMAPITWLDAVRQVISGNYTFLVIQELDLIYPLIETYLESPDPEIAAWTQKLLNQVQKSPPPPLRVVTLGKLQVWVGLNLVPARALRQRRAGELLVLLLYSPNRSLLFDQVSECLWPGRDPALTKTLFHHACASLRQALEPGLPSRLVSRYLAIKDDRITLTVPENSWIDGDVFEGHYHKGEWQSCIDLYRGDFLPDYLYADWTLSYRQRFVQLILNALAARIQTCERDGQPRELLELCQQILSLEPWHEPATLAGMRACQHMNDRTGALRLYQNLEKTMKNELSVAPSAEVQAFYQELIQSSG
jgi:DNA-binding SARP family transcriptional activator